jgi:hypothetical protein
VKRIASVVSIRVITDRMLRRELQRKGQRSRGTEKGAELEFAPLALSSFSYFTGAL